MATVVTTWQHFEKTYPKIANLVTDFVSDGCYDPDIQGDYEILAIMYPTSWSEEHLQELEWMIKNCKVEESSKKSENQFLGDIELKFKPTLLDITKAEYVDIQIRRDRKVIWINTEDGCVLRISNIKHLTGPKT